MAWQDDLVKIVRNTIGDTVPPYLYSDSRIRQTILVAAKFVNQEIWFQNEYTVTLGASGTISPDPTLNCDKDAQTFIALKTAALLDQAEARNMLNGAGVTVNFGPSQISTKDQSGAIKALLSEGAQKAYERAKWEYEITNNIGVYETILTPASLAYAFQVETTLSCEEGSICSPYLSFEDNGDETVDISVLASCDGYTNQIQVSGSWINIGASFTGDNTRVFSSGVGNYFARLEYSGAVARYTEPVSFTNYPRIFSFSFTDSGNNNDFLFSMNGSNPSSFSHLQYKYIGDSGYTTFASGNADSLSGQVYDLNIASGAYYGRVLNVVNGIFRTSSPQLFNISLARGTVDATNSTDGSGATVSTHNINVFHLLERRMSGSGEGAWAVVGSGVGSKTYYLISGTGNYDVRMRNEANGGVIYSDYDTYNVSNALYSYSPTLVVTDLNNTSGALYSVTGSYSLATNILQAKPTSSSTWTNYKTFTGNSNGTFYLPTSGTYHGRIQSSYALGVVFSPQITFTLTPSGTPPAPPSDSGNPELMTMPTSDSNMRGMTNAGHFFWDPSTFVEYTFEGCRDAKVVLGTRINYGNAIESTISNCSGNPFEGYANAAQLSAGIIHCRTRYANLYNDYKGDYPDTLVGSYVASYNLKTIDWMYQVGKNYPPDSDRVDPFLPDCTGVGNPSAAPGSVGGVKLTEQGCIDISNDRFTAMGCGTLRNGFKEDGIWFDEVGYTNANWNANKERLATIKTRLNSSGVHCCMNLGGTNLDAPQFFGPDLLPQIVNMCNLVTLEGPFSDSTAVDGNPIKSESNIRKIISSYRGLMDSGVAIMMVPTSAPQDCKRYSISSVSETDGGTHLLITFTETSRVFPHGGYAVEKLVFSELPNPYGGLENYGWTPLYDNSILGTQVKIYNRFTSLSSIKSALGLGTISFTGGTLEDQQSSVRMMAGMAMMIRRPGDSLFVSQGPSESGSTPGVGASGNAECWWYWPQQMGAPTTDFIIDTVSANGVITQMHRDFTHGTVTVFPSGNYVVYSPA